MYNEFTRGYGDAKLLPHQEELIAKAKAMGHRAWPGMPRPNLSDVQMPNTQVGETPEAWDERFTLSCMFGRRTAGISFVDHVV